jgi:hypothetical protein
VWSVGEVMYADLSVVEEIAVVGCGDEMVMAI